MYVCTSQKRSWNKRRQGKAAVGHRGVVGPKFARTKDRGNMSCKSGANAVVALVNRSIPSGASSSSMRRESRRDDEKRALLLHNNSRSTPSSLAKPGSGHDLKMQQQLRQEGRRLPGDHHLLEMQQQQGDFQKETFSSGGPHSSRKRPSTAAAGPMVLRESKDHVIASLKQKLQQLTTKVVIMQEQSTAAAAEEAQSVARMLEILESKDREIASLRDQLADLKTDMVVLKEKSVAAKSWSDGSTTTTTIPTGSYKDDDTAPSPKILQYATSAVKEATNSFAKTFIQKMIQIPDLNNRKTLEDRIRKESGDVLLSCENHSKFLVQAFICRRLYEGFENESFNIESCMSWDVDQQQYTQACFNQFQLYRRNMNTVSILINNEPHDNFLRQFCFQKFQAIVDEHTELLLFGNTQHSAKINRHKHPCTEFYQSFCKLAVAVWLVHRLAFSFDCPARIFRARKGQAFQASFMTSVVPWTMEDEEDAFSSSSTTSVVGVMVLPGFRVSKSIIETQVYLEHNHT
jgi:hypothetical protein